MESTIIVGTDLGQASDEALIRADWLARRDDAQLVIAHALTTHVWGDVGDQHEIANAREAIRERLGLLTHRTPGEYEVQIERGAPHSVLPRLAQERHALLVLGSSSNHHLGHALLRDTSERIIRHTPGRLLVARPRSPSRRIVLALSRLRDPDADALLELGRLEADRSASELTVLHCIDTGFIETLTADLLGGGAYADRPLGNHSPTAHAYRSLAAQCERLHVSAELKVIEGDPRESILRFVSRQCADLLIIARGSEKTTSDGTLALVQGAPCSVLVVDPREWPAWARAGQGEQRLDAMAKPA